jgi:hypothetical protein
MPEHIENPIARFYLEGDPEDAATVIGIVDLFGESGQQVEVTFTDANHAASLGQLFFECAHDIADGQENGIMAVVERKGQDIDDEELTVEDILGESNDDN